MRRGVSIGLLMGLALSLFTCIKPIAVEVPELEEGIFVSATLYTQKGFQDVRLTRLAPFTTKGLNYPVQGAQVWIEDNVGQRQNFREDPTRAGIYLPSDVNYVGEVGKTYVLHISTKDQYTYVSTPQTIRAVPPLKRVYREEIIVDDPKFGTVVSGFNILLDMDDPPTKGDHYRWTWVNYDYAEYCFLRPEPDGTNTGFGCCTPCWDIYRCYINCSNVLSDVFVNGKTITRRPIHKIPYCTEDYYIEVLQRSISTEAYTYWRTVDQLSTNNGSLFDTAPAAVRGNLSCTSHTDQEVYGLFEVADIAENGYFISRVNTSKPGLLTCQLGPPITPAIDCAKCIESPYRTQIKPRFWAR